jgi:hypothetical protein
MDNNTDTPFELSSIPETHLIARANNFSEEIEHDQNKWIQTLEEE